MLLILEQNDENKRAATYKDICNLFWKRCKKNADFLVDYNIIKKVIRHLNTFGPIME